MQMQALTYLESIVDAAAAGYFGPDVAGIAATGSLRSSFAVPGFGSGLARSLLV